MNRMAQFGNDLYSGRRSFDFVFNWKRNIGIGLALCTVALICLAVFRLNPGIEFRGGAEFRITETSVVDTTAAVNAVNKVVPGAEPPRATVVAGNSIRVQTQKLTDAQTNDLRAELATAYKVQTSSVTSSYIGPTFGAEVSRKALMGLGVFLAFVSVLLFAYFRTWAMSISALVALGHDLLITVGVYSATGFEVTPASVIGFLTILGYSLYDTVVVFDKVRENTAHVMSSTKRTYAEASNLAVNQTLVRSINTSIVALLPVSAIFFIGALLLGAGTLRDISLSLLVGMLVGTYSSVFVAPAVFVLIRSRDPKVKEQTERVERARAKRAAAEATPAPEPVTVVAAAAATPSDAVTPDVARTATRRGQRQQPRRRGR